VRKLGITGDSVTTIQESIRRLKVLPNLTGIERSERGPEKLGKGKRIAAIRPAVAVFPFSSRVGRLKISMRLHYCHVSTCSKPNGKYSGPMPTVCQITQRPALC
jgi:hypothetical protein